ncbi:hypothetical protein ACFL96_15510 [Thermoproteota archaeon]
MNSKHSSDIKHRLLLNLLVFSLFSTIALVANFGVAFAQETGRVDVLVEGYDGNTVMNAVIYNSNITLLENITINEPTFNFENLPIGDQYLILLDYNGVTYHDQIWINQSSQSSTIFVFDKSSSDAELIVEIHHITINSGDNYLNVTEYIEYSNFGNTVINNTKITLELPDGFKNFIWNQDCCLETADFGLFFLLTEPLLPNGTKSLNYKYRLDTTGNEYIFEKKIYYDTFLVILTVDPNELEVTSWDNLQSEGLVDIGEKMFDAYTVSNIFKGQEFSITLTGYTSNELGELNLLWIGTGILIILIIVGIIYGFKRSKVSIEQLKSEDEALVSVLGQLKKDFTSKKIEEVEYLKLQLKYKKQLEKVRYRIKEFEKVNIKS